jgi:hypothetical protein
MLLLMIMLRHLVQFTLLGPLDGVLYNLSLYNLSYSMPFLLSERKRFVLRIRILFCLRSIIKIMT